MEFTAETIAAFLSGEIEGNKDAKVTTVAKIEEATEGTLAFLANAKYEDYLYTTGASIVLVAKTLELRKAVSATLIRVEDPYASFARLLDLYNASKTERRGVSPRASIAEGVEIPESSYVGDFAVVESGAKIGSGVKIYPHCYVGEGVEIGDDVTLYPRVTIYEGCKLGNRIIIHSGAVIGADGFGFAPQSDGSYSKIAQIGNVEIADDVEIGANTCIDRATMGSTRIKQGVKLDNLIQVAHNVTIGKNTVAAAQMGVAGSTKIGSEVMIGGQVGIAGHISIADKVKILSQSGINNTIEKEGDMLLGSPAINGISFHRAYAIFKQLPQLRKKVLDMEKELLGLTQQKEE
ncbi:MAG: UDP-3-O-(3-hydroxymyristoyl)glucosamine N-acyltransferase [Rikenellaceae bacterium]